MIKINDKILTNEEVIEMLQQETGSGKMKHDVEFCLLENYQSSIRTINDLGETRWVKKYQTSYGLTNQYDRRDFKTGGTQTVIYFTNIVKDPQRGDRYHTGEMNKIVFHNGYLIVRAGQEDLLLFMRLNEQCKTNKYWQETDKYGNQKYLPTRSFLFKEIIQEVESEQQFQEVYEGLNAQSIAMDKDKLPYAQAITMALGYGFADAQLKGEKAVRLFLHGKAKANPDQFMKDMQDSSFELRSKVNASFQLGICKWDSPYIRWGGKIEGDNRIVSVPPQKDHVDYFTFWLKEIDKSGTMNTLLSKVEKETLKSYGVQFNDEPTEQNKLLKDLGVSSLHELRILIDKGRGSNIPKAPLSEDIQNVVKNIDKYTKEDLQKLSLEDLKAIASEFGIRGIHLFKKEEKVADAIWQRVKVATA